MEKNSEDGGKILSSNYYDGYSRHGRSLSDRQQGEAKSKVCVCSTTMTSRLPASLMLFMVPHPRFSFHASWQVDRQPQWRLVSEFPDFSQQSGPRFQPLSAWSRALSESELAINIPCTVVKNHLSLHFSSKFTSQSIKISHSGVYANLFLHYLS